MFWFLFVLNLLVLGLMFGQGIRRGRLHSVLYGALLGLQLASLLRLGSDVHDFGWSTMTKGQAMMLVGNTLLSLVLLVGERLQGARAGGEPLTVERSTVGRYALVCIGLILLAFVLRFRGGIGAGLQSWQDRRSEAGLLDSMSTFASLLVIPCPVVLWRARRRVLAMATVPPLALLVQLTGSRALALTIPSLVWLVLIRRPGPTSRKLMQVGALAIVAVVGFQMFRVVRNLKVTDIPSSLLPALRTPGNDISGGESTIMTSYYFVVAQDDDRYPYRTGVTPLRLATIYVPRSVSKAVKPEDITYQVWTDYLAAGYSDQEPSYRARREAADASTPGSEHSTLWGDAYLNLGVIGIATYALVLAALLGLVEAVSRRLSGALQVMVLPVAAVTYQFLARGNVVIALGYLAYAVPIAVVAFAITRLPVVASADGTEQFPSAAAVAG